MSIEALIERHIEALEKNTATLERVIVGQEAALAKIEPAKAPSTRKKAETPAATDTAAEQPAAETPKADPVVEQKPEPETVTAPEVTDDDIRAAAGAWTNGKSVEERTAAAQWMGTILQHFGVGGKLTGADSKLDADMRKQTLFFIKRKAAGQPVDFNADYDFDGEPTQGAAASDDPLG